MVLSQLTSKGFRQQTLLLHSYALLG